MITTQLQNNMEGDNVDLISDNSSELSEDIWLGIANQQDDMTPTPELDYGSDDDTLVESEFEEDDEEQPVTPYLVPPFYRADLHEYQWHWYTPFLYRAIWISQILAFKVVLDGGFAFNRDLQVQVSTTFLILSQAFLVFEELPTITASRFIYIPAAFLMVLTVVAVADDVKARILRVGSHKNLLDLTARSLSVVKGELNNARYWAAINSQRPRGCEFYQECHLVTAFVTWTPPANQAYPFAE